MNLRDISKTNTLYVASQNMSELLPETHPDFVEIEQILKNANMIIKKVRKFETEDTIEKFNQEKNIMEEHLMLKLGDPENAEKLRIIELFHGTSETPENVWSEGLDTRTHNHCRHFGKGIYFSQNPAFARIEAELDGGPKVIYRCKVILGNSMVYRNEEMDPKLKREPRGYVDGKLMIYDSAEGNISGLHQVVVYEKRRVLIKYSIEYETSEPLPALSLFSTQSEEVDAGSDTSSNGSGNESDDDNYQTPDEDQNVYSNNKKMKKVSKPPGVIKDILSHLMSIKGSHTKEIFDNLLVLFYKTYLQSERSSQPIAEEIWRGKVEEFCYVSKCTSEMEAKIFLAVNHEDVNGAALNYISLIKS